MAARKELTEQKEKYFAELSAQYEAMNNLVKRNMQGNMEGHRIELPFILVKVRDMPVRQLFVGCKYAVGYVHLHLMWTE